MSRTLVICPGRGSYTSSTLGWIGRHGHHGADLVARADARREAHGEPRISELDASERFDARTMLVGADAASLTFVSSVCDLQRLDLDRVEPVAFLGNSMGWYTALYGAGALGFDDALELVETMGGMQEHGAGSQLLYPTVDDTWRADPEALALLERALEETGTQWSIRLGGIAVLAGEDEALSALEKALPTVQLGHTSYPYRLTFHAAYHTHLMAEASRRGRSQLEQLSWRTPAVSLVDGSGRVHRPRISDPALVQSYTLGEQVTETFDFTAALAVALKSFGPEQIVLLGPGSALGAPVAQALIGLGWQGLDSRAAFEERQASDAPLVIAMDREEQASRVTLPQPTG